MTLCAIQSVPHFMCFINVPLVVGPARDTTRRKRISFHRSEVGRSLMVAVHLRLTANIMARWHFSTCLKHLGRTHACHQLSLAFVTVLYRFHQDGMPAQIAHVLHPQEQCEGSALFYVIMRWVSGKKEIPIFP